MLASTVRFREFARRIAFKAQIRKPRSVPGLVHIGTHYVSSVSAITLPGRGTSPRSPRLLTKRTYSKHTYLIPLLLIALALPAVALAAPDGGGSQRIGLADAQPASLSRADGAGAELPPGDPRQRPPHPRCSPRPPASARTTGSFRNLPGGVSQATLDAIGACESGGDPTAVSSDGTYRGKYQFDYGTWESVGGSGDPAAASEQEQDYRAALLYAQSGSSPWPVCG